MVAAREVFALQGSDASMVSIAHRAGVGAGTLYRHFPHRIDLVEAVYRVDVEELAVAAESAVRDLAPWEALRDWLDSFLRYSLGKRVFQGNRHVPKHMSTNMGDSRTCAQSGVTTRILSGRRFRLLPPETKERVFGNALPQ